MKYSTDLEVCDLVRAFEARAIARDNWRHPQHLVVALFYCAHFSLNKAVAMLRDGITALNEVHLASSAYGYNETLTVFWTKEVFGFLEDNARETSLSRLANRVMQQFHDSSWPLRFYSRERLFSPEAKNNYLPPDLDRKDGYDFVIADGDGYRSLEVQRFAGEIW